MRGSRLRRLSALADALAAPIPTAATQQEEGQGQQEQGATPAVINSSANHLRHPSDRAEEYATMSRRERYLFDLQVLPLPPRGRRPSAPRALSG